MNNKTDENINKFVPDVIVMQNDIRRILDHHSEFRKLFSSMNEKLNEVVKSVYDEKSDRLKSLDEIKDQIHGRINMILFSILGGAIMFISGIVMWVIQSKAAN